MFVQVKRRIVDDARKKKRFVRSFISRESFRDAWASNIAIIVGETTGERVTVFPMGGKRVQEKSNR